jgi:hypothetical protein
MGRAAGHETTGRRLSLRQHLLDLETLALTNLRAVVAPPVKGTAIERLADSAGPRPPLTDLSQDQLCPVQVAVTAEHN